MKKKRAGASTWNPNAPAASRWPGQKQVVDPWLLSMRDAGIKFWAKRGVTISPQTALDIATDLRVKNGDPDIINARGSKDPTDPSGGRIVLDNWNTHRLMKQARNKRKKTSTRRQALNDLSEIIFHELGHIGGLDHTQGGIMNESYLDETIPWEGRVLTHKLIPRSKRGRSR